MSNERERAVARAYYDVVRDATTITDLPALHRFSSGEAKIFLAMYDAARAFDERKAGEERKMITQSYDPGTM